MDSKAFTDGMTALAWIVFITGVVAAGIVFGGCWLLWHFVFPHIHFA